MAFERDRQSGGTASFVVLGLALAAWACGGGGDASPGASDGNGPPTGDEAPAAVGPVLPGVEVLLRDSLHLVRDRRVGLVTNHTALARNGTHAIDLLDGASEVDLSALYSPEHGIRGDAEAGEAVASGRDARSGLPVHSLYGDTRKPTPEMLRGVDVLLFDIQDIGARYYTYVSTMALAMEAAGEAEIPFVVLDRPNPIGGTEVQGNVLDAAFSSFVGLYPVPMRHGMTPGELARLFRADFGVDVELHVVPVEGWSRDAVFPDTGLPWVAPSPNMPTLESALHYPGTCLFEGTNLSVARGTDRPFQQVGAPWLDGEELARRLNDRSLPGVRFRATRFTPERPGDGKFGGTEVRGVRFERIGDAYDPTMAAVAALVEARRLAGDRWAWRPAHFDRLAGTDSLRLGIEAGRSVEDLTARWDDQLRDFMARRAEHLLYPQP